mmetsp:Transcript_15481/g.46728  ORF Transcript_15481/g.46728 Transcript_15481/m.46728 type:complete len:226 (+) Transcript_15481:2053-2730(+)
MRPGMGVPFQTLPGSWHAPVDPRCLCDFEAPCEAGPPANPKRFMTPWKPFPIVIPATSTYCPATKCDAVILVPTGNKPSFDTLNSERCLLMGTPAALKCPRCAPLTCFPRLHPIPSCRPLYPFFAVVLTCVTWQSSIQRIVSGSRTPYWSQSCVMPTLIAMTPVLLGYSNFSAGAESSSEDEVTCVSAGWAKHRSCCKTLEPPRHGVSAAQAANGSAADRCAKNV